MPQDDAFFMQEMRKLGTNFRFTNDPNNIYKVVAVEDYVSNVANYSKWDGEGPTSYPTFGQGEIRPASTNAAANGRIGFSINFRKIDIATNKIINEGIDTASFDPRGVARHDGRDGINTSGATDTSHQLSVELLRKQNLGGTQLIFDSDPAILETEPKKDLDLDIYYEGSDSIPITLNEYNIYDFAPFDCGVSIERTNHLTVEKVSLPLSAPGDIISNPSNKIANAIGKPNIFNDNFTAFTSTEIEYGIGDPIVHVTKTDSSENVTNQLHGIYINDDIIFNHKNGVRARSRVTGFFTKNEKLNDASPPEVVAASYSPVVVHTGTIQADPSFTIGGSVAQGEWDVSAGSVQNEVQINTGGTVDALEVGMQVVGVGVDPGVIVSEIISTNPARIMLSSSLATPFYFATSTGVLQTGSEFATTNVMGETFDVEFVGPPTGYYSIDKEVWKYPIDLSWSNCYAYGNGVESDRIRDDFNAPQIDNGVRASTTFSGYGKEDRTSGLIYSGLYNSTSQVNDLNEFNMSQKITKDLNPSYGTIQRLKTRDTDVVVFTEDKILKILSSKDALFNADGNPQLTASNRVLGTAIPFVGNYGISKNPESLAWDQYRMYFTDKQRGAVLRLSQDGLTPISNVGMKTWFRDNLKLANKALGTFDTVSGEYNLTLTKTISDSTYDTTISFSEESKGWVSFKTFLPEAGGSVSGSYITAKGNTIWQHYTNSLYNCFYGVDPNTNQNYESSISVLFNDSPGSIKSFNSVNYEGSQSRVVQNTSDVNEFYNLNNKTGWYVDSFETDKHSGTVPEFVEKEGKWFNKINGVVTTLTNLDTGEFTVQGIGSPSIVSGIYT